MFVDEVIGVSGRHTLPPLLKYRTVVYVWLPTPTHRYILQLVKSLCLFNMNQTNLVDQFESCCRKP